MSYFDHEKLHVYQAAMEFVLLTDKIIKKFPQGRAHLADQLHRAGTSILLNIAEGAGEYAENEKIRFYRMSRRYATECSAILQLGNHLALIESNDYLKSRELLMRIIGMLTKLTKINSVTETQAVAVTI